ncbi:helix-turn-helix domain-containing protein [Paenibacillus sp. MBLB4367]|uniref:helix-turn-helix domain-containing protein n=1 Tax=Paenibacillus sp. MBLB4367 TaxID=3384767 RepID=UPI0039080869
MERITKIPSLKALTGLITRRSLFITLLFSYLLMLIVPVIAETVTHSKYADLLKKETANYNLSILRQAQRVLDERLHNIEEVANNLSFSPDIQRFLNVGPEMDAADKLNMSKAVQMLSRFKSANSFIDSIYIYFNKPDIILSHSTKSTPDTLYSDVTRYPEWTQEQWKALLQQKHVMEYRPVKEAIDNSTMHKDLLILLQTFSFGPTNGPYATLVISIDQNKIKELLTDIPFLNKGAVYVTDNNKHVLVGMGDQHFLNQAKESDIPFHNDSVYTTIGNRESIMSSVTSKPGGWTYVSVIPTAVIMHDAKYIQKMTLLISGCLFAAGVALAFALARGNYRPIKKLAVWLKEKFTEGDGGTTITNELQFIEYAANTALRENDAIKKSMDRQMPILRSHFLTHLVKGSVYVDDNLESSLESMGIRFPAGFYCFLLVNVDEYHAHSMEERNFSKFVIGNVLEHLGGGKAAVYTVDIDLDRLGLLINLHDAGEHSRKEIQEIADQTLQFIMQKFSNYISVAIGGIHEGMTGINKSYNEALTAIDYQVVKGLSTVIDFAEIETAASDQTYIYPTETEVLLINSIKLGDSKRALAILQEVFDLNFVSGKLGLGMARCLFFDMMGTAFKVLGSFSVPYEHIFGREFNPYEELTSCRTIQEMQKILEVIYVKACRFVVEKKKSNNLGLKENIIRYMENNYADYNLGLAAVANAFSINPTYLSNFFKEQTGQNFMSYMNGIRLEAAKRYLIHETLTLQEIAQRVGYSNSGVLIRNFKKVEGMTPGEYRENNK